MRFLRLLSAAILTVMALGVFGCGGGGAKVQSEQSSYSTTLGQELKDLEEAYQKGMISQKQYEDAKRSLIEQRTKK